MGPAKSAKTNAFSAETDFHPTSLLLVTLSPSVEIFVSANAAGAQRLCLGFATILP
jgi:hypothetical protein